MRTGTPCPDDHRPVPAVCGLTVLVVEDDLAIRALLTDVLEGRGHVVLGAVDAVGGLRALRANACIDLLVADVELPAGLNGAQMAEAARAMRPHLPVLLIPGNAETALTKDGASRSDMQVMAKPFTLRHFANRIEGMIGG